jgi:hypothetical protein
MTNRGTGSTLLYRDTTWSGENSNLYASSVTTGICGATYCPSAITTQKVNAWGNLTEKHQYDYSGSPLRDYYRICLPG